MVPFSRPYALSLLPLRSLVARDYLPDDSEGLKASTCMSNCDQTIEPSSEMWVKARLPKNLAVS